MAEGSVSQEEISSIVSHKSKIFNDPIHGHIELPELCVKIVDTPQFQRLRYIRQLGGAYFVYPGASHNRFEHSLGVCHLAGEMVKTLQTAQPTLRITKQDKLCVQVAGLCHDLGHGPFSHLFDQQFMAIAKPEKKWEHEQCSIDMLHHLLDENKIDLANYGLKLPGDRTFIEELIFGPLHGGTYEGRPEDMAFLYQIVANKESGIDVDKWDYFERDCHGLGLKSMFQHTRLMKSARVIGSNICFRNKDALNVYGMFHTRETLHRTAYKHKTVIAIQEMITEALVAADKFVKIEGYCMSECVDNMKAYTQLNDNVYHKIVFSTDPDLEKARSILERVEKRQLYRCVGEAKTKNTGERQDANAEKVFAEKIREYKQSLEEDDLFVVITRFDYGMRNSNPVDKVQFYWKDDPDKSKPIPREQVSHMLPECFQDEVIRCYCRQPDKYKTVKHCFENWCKDESTWVQIA